MKKGLAALGAALLVMLGASCALAAGQATITQQMAQTYSYYDTHYAYYFAQIENTGDVPILLDSGNLEFYDAEGQTIYQTSVYAFHPAVLGPGERAVVREYTNLDAPDALASFKFDLSAREASAGSIVYVNCVGSFSQMALSDSEYMTTITAAVTNDQADMLRNMMIVYMLYDADGKLIFVDTLSPNFLSVYPGSTVELSTTVDEEIETTWRERGIKPASAFVYAYVAAD